ncbi:MAG: hypothetical protein ABI361_06245 [Nitrososphaera sp.]|jgi:hypothetical protein
MVDVKAAKEGRGFSVSEGKKIIVIKEDKAKAAKMELTNEYGNSVTYALDKAGFDELWANIWEFVKDRQH